MCWLLYTNFHKAKHTTGGPFHLRDRKKASISRSLQKVCLGWKLYPIFVRGGGVGIRMSWVEKNRKLN